MLHKGILILAIARSFKDREMERQHQLLSKIATNDRHGENSPYFDGWKAYDKNPFHPTDNPDGVIQMGLAENQVNISCWRILSLIRFCYNYKVNALIKSMNLINLELHLPFSFLILFLCLSACSFPLIRL